jgi:hypothetical protein
MEGLQYQLELTIRRLVHDGWNPSHSPVWETNALKTLQLGQQVMSRINCTTMRLKDPEGQGITVHILYENLRPRHILWKNSLIIFTV